MPHTKCFQNRHWSYWRIVTEDEWMNETMQNMTHSSMRESTCFLKHCMHTSHTTHTHSKHHERANNMRQNVVKLVTRSLLGQRHPDSKIDEVWICSFMSRRANFWLPSNHKVIVKYSMNSLFAVNLNHVWEPNNLWDGKQSMVSWVNLNGKVYSLNDLIHMRGLVLVKASILFDS